MTITKIELKQNKFCSKEEMVSILESRGLIVDNPAILDKINYSHLIHKYGKFYFQENKKKEKFIEGTKLSHIYNLLNFNIDLASFLFKVIYKFEHELKNVIAFNFANVGEISYLQESSYLNDQKSKEEVKKLINELKSIEIKNRHKYDKNSYFSDRLPIWLLIDQLSFNQLTKILRFLKKNTENQIFKDLKISKPWILYNIYYFRNNIFHANPLKKKLKIYNEYKNRTANYYLNDFLKFIKLKYKEDFQKIKNFINQFDYTKINIDKNKILNYLGIEIKL